MSQTSYSRDTKVAIEVVVYCPKFMLQYVVHNNIIIMKYSSPSIVILSLNSKRIRCFFRALFQGLRQMIQQFFFLNLWRAFRVGGGRGNKRGGGGHTILQNGKTYNVRIRQTKRSMGDPIKRENQSSAAFFTSFKKVEL